MLLSTEQRLNTLIDSPLDSVGSALNLAAVLDRHPKAETACYVIPVAEQPEADSRNFGPALQKMRVTVGVVFAVGSVNDPTGERGSLRLEAARDAVRDQLFGWTPEGAHAPYVLGSSEIVKMEKGAIWWIDRYQSQRQRRAAKENR